MVTTPSEGTDVKPGDGGGAGDQTHIVLNEEVEDILICVVIFCLYLFSCGEIFYCCVRVQLQP